MSLKMSSEDDHEQQQQFLTKADFDEPKSSVQLLIEESNSTATRAGADPAPALAKGLISIAAPSFVDHDNFLLHAQSQVQPQAQTIAAPNVSSLYKPCIVSASTVPVLGMFVQAIVDNEFIDFMHCFPLTCQKVFVFPLQH